MNSNQTKMNKQDIQIQFAKGNGYTVVRSKEAAVVFAFKKTEPVRPGGDPAYYCKCWVGKRSRTEWYYRFRTFGEMETQCNQVVTNVKHWEAAKKERAAQRKAAKASDHYSVGDILVNSWGYEQTNVDFYEVVRVMAKSIELREIGSRITGETGYMSGTCQPIPGSFREGADGFRKTVGSQGYVGFKHGGSHKWEEGKDERWSSYH